MFAKTLLLCLALTLSLSQRVKLLANNEIDQFHNNTDNIVPLGSINSNPFLVEASLGMNSYIFGLSLYEGNTIISESCAIFPQQFTCGTQNECTASQWYSNFPYVYFMGVSNNRAVLGKNLTFGGWSSVNENYNLNLVSSCSGITFPGTSGIPFVGVIGLGLGPENSYNNSFNCDQFTISLNNATNGEMSFGFDENLQNGTAVASFNTTGNWYYILGGVRFGKDLTLYVAGGIFDLNMPYILVPKTAYNSIVAKLLEYGLECMTHIYLGDAYAQQCYSTANSSDPLSNLPDLTFDTLNGTFSLSPADYFIEVSGNYYLLIVPTDTNPAQNGVYYVIPNYSDTIVLGKPLFLAYNLNFNFEDPAYPIINLFQNQNNLMKKANTDTYASKF